MSEPKKYYWLKLKKDFFKREDIRIIESFDNGKEYVLFYLKMLVESMSHEGNLRLNNNVIYDEKMLSAITNTDINIVNGAIKVFTNLNMIEMLVDKSYQIKDLTTKDIISSQEESGRDRNTTEYKNWRKQVYERDNYTCQECKTRGVKLNAHHIKQWCNNIKLRFDINNGITLCEKCHKKIHSKGCK